MYNVLHHWEDTWFNYTKQVYNKINNYELLSINSVSKIIDYSKIRQTENNNIFKDDKFKYLRLYFKNEKPYYKIY